MGEPNEKYLRDLSRRERQIMEILYQRREATAAEVQKRLPDPPSYSAVRALLRVLEEKGHVEHGHDGPRYVYRPTVEPDTAKVGALKHLMQTFFEGSAEKMVAALLDESDSAIAEDELERMAQLIDDARERGQ